VAHTNVDTRGLGKTGGAEPALFHVWFSTKQRRWLLQGDIVDAAREEVARVAFEHKIKLLEYECIVDHVHLLLETTLNELPRTMNYLKGASARRLFQRFPDLKLDAHTHSFWQTGYAAKAVPQEALATTRNYIRTQWDRLEEFEKIPRNDPLART